MLSAFHPDLHRYAWVTPRAVVGPRSLPLVRAGTRLLGLRHPKDVTVVRVSDTATVRVHRPETVTSTGALLWMHGGGMVIGSAQQDDGICRRFARKLGMVVAAVDYRLAPDHPFPAPLDDCFDALQWLGAQPGIDRVAIGGASAGGGLAAGLALRARDTGGVRPVFQLLVYPMIDDRTALRTDVDTAHLRAWSPKANAFGWRSYLGGAPAGPLSAPARATDLAGLPPAWIGVGTLDLFHDEDLAYAKRLVDAGVPCALEVVRGAFHGFDILAPRSGVSRDFVRSQITALRSGLG